MGWTPSHRVRKTHRGQEPSGRGQSALGSALCIISCDWMTQHHTPPPPARRSAQPPWKRPSDAPSVVVPPPTGTPLSIRTERGSAQLCHFSLLTFSNALASCTWNNRQGVKGSFLTLEPGARTLPDEWHGSIKCHLPCWPADTESIWMDTLPPPGQTHSDRIANDHLACKFIVYEEGGAFGPSFPPEAASAGAEETKWRNRSYYLVTDLFQSH